MKSAKGIRKGQVVFVLALVLLMTGCVSSKVLTKPSSAEKMIHYSELPTLGESINLNNYVLYVNAGESIPLKISMETDFMEFGQDHVDIVAKQKLYFMIKMPEDLTSEELARLSKLEARDFSEMTPRQRRKFMKNYMLFVSKDAEHWAPLYGSKAYRQVLGFRGGMLSFGVMASTTDGLGASLDIRTVK